MTINTTLTRPELFRFRIWHLWLLADFAAVAVLNIEDQRRSEPVLIGLAAAGFAVYAVLGWVAWRQLSRLRTRFSPVAILAAYLCLMSALFLVATVAYLGIEHAYLIAI